MKILSVVGTRPNFIKIAPILRAIERTPRGAQQAPIQSVLVHTGQHYDDEMSAVFFADLQMPKPDRILGVAPGSHGGQTAEIMHRFEPVILAERPDAVLVVGDVNSTMACALTAAKCNVRVVHVEAGLRSFDRRMPEEINRVVTDALADILFTTEESANENLRREGHPAEQIFFVGNVMIDSLLSCLQSAKRSTILDQLGLGEDRKTDYAFATLHRPGNVDAESTLRGIVRALAELAVDMPVILPAHPRTRARIEAFDLSGYVCPATANAGRLVGRPGRVSLLNPLGYLDCVRLMSEAALVLTDSGGIQEETTCLGIPCLTLRENTERPITLTAGTNILVGTDPDRILTCARRIVKNGAHRVGTPPLWDGHAAERVVAVLLEQL